MYARRSSEVICRLVDALPRHPRIDQRVAEVVGQSVGEQAWQAPVGPLGKIGKTNGALAAASGIVSGASSMPERMKPGWYSKA